MGMPIPQLPVDLAKGEQTLTASTPAEYHDLVWRGFTVAAAEENLTPQQKAARTRAANKAAEELENSQEGHTETTAGDAVDPTE